MLVVKLMSDWLSVPLHSVSKKHMYTQKSIDQGFKYAFLANTTWSSYLSLAMLQHNNLATTDEVYINALQCPQQLWDWLMSDSLSVSLHWMNSFFCCLYIIHKVWQCSSGDSCCQRTYWYCPETVGVRSKPQPPGQGDNWLSHYLCGLHSHNNKTLIFTP